MLLITRLYIRFWKRRHRSSRFVESNPGRTYHVCVMLLVPGVALGLSCVTYCHIRIKLAATSTTDEPAFLATLIDMSVCSPNSGCQTNLKWCPGQSGFSTHKHVVTELG